MLKIEKKMDKDKAVFVLDGSLEASTAPKFQSVLNESLDGVTDLTLDCGALEYVSSAGLRVLLAAQKIMNKQGSMKLIKVLEPVMHVFEMTGFSDVLTIVTEEAAEEKEEK